ncbi:TetR/AcrR family transcriptional regulator [Actinopolymorpha pittospori]
MSRSRAEVLLDAAISVVAESGLRGLTHRAVDARAEVPPGSTSYYFRTRAALLRGLLGRLLDLDERDTTRLGEPQPDGAQHADAEPPQPHPGPDLGTLTDAWTRLFQYWLGPGRERLRARYALYLEGRHHPELREMLDTASARIVAGAEQFLTAVGAPAPERDAPFLIALLDGILYDQVIRADPPADGAELRRRIEVVLRAVWPPAPPGAESAVE